MAKKKIFILPKVNFHTLINCFYETPLVPEFRFGRYRIDFYSEELKLAFEYDGIHHYSVSQKIASDFEKRRILEADGIKVIRWPFYLMPTKDVVSYIFADEFSEEKYQRMLISVLGITRESDMPSPGFHDTDNIPGNFIEVGINRFLDEIREFPESLEHQVRYSLKLYCQKSKLGANAIPAHHKAFMDFYVTDCKKEYLNFYFSNQ